LTKIRRRGGKPRGFTLIELLIVVVVTGVLLAIAVPSYISYVRQGRRPEAKTALLDLAAREERYYTVNNVYTGTMTALGYPAGTINLGNGPDYTLAVTTPASGATGTTYTLTATAANDQANDQCGSYTLTNLGLQGNTGNVLASTSCW
jgi:type IV pilus assembly protein PilE